jgi:GntR family transcriptional regulator, gluconate operon transcriptional repressor
MKDPAHTLEPLKAPRSLTEEAADGIREQILRGGFKPGQHLVETKIAHELDISRGPVREAFKLLRAEGLLKEEPRRGTFVVSLSAQDVREIYGLRAALEGRAARMLTRGQDAAAIDALRAVAADIETAVERSDPVAVSRADLAFHETLCRLCGNARIHEVFMRYVPTLRGLLRLDEHVIGSLAEISAQHRVLVEAIESGEEDRAAELFREHAEHAGELISPLVAADD